MANIVKLKRSAISGKIPTTSDLALGELGLNTYDGKLYTKKDQNGTEEVVEIGAGGSGSGSSTFSGLTDTPASMGAAGQYLRIDASGNALEWTSNNSAAVEAQAVTTARTIDANLTLASGRNMLSINDVIVADGVTVDVPDGSTWVVVA